MYKNFQYFNIDSLINDNRDIKGIILDNDIKIVLISDDNAPVSSCSICVNAGYNLDEIHGTAHFLEHLLFMGSSKFPDKNEYHNYIESCGGVDNAFTTDNYTCYYMSLETTFLKKGLEILSWFFREPLLRDENINSEMEIIDSEHQKNILSDAWIKDDIFKKFIDKPNKYKNFGTGNSESLKHITQSKILEFYNNYYNTNKICICIIDSKSIEEMIDNYLDYFIDIPKKISIKDNNSEKLKLINNNLIIYNSTSDYYFINFYLIFNNVDNKNQIDYQLINLISYILGSEFKNSLCFFFKEENFVKEIFVSTDYEFDFEKIINIEIICNNNNKETFDIIYIHILYFIDIIKNINFNDFYNIYEHFRKIKILNGLISDYNNTSDLSINITDNLNKSSSNYCIIRDYIVPEFNKEVFNRFNQIINNYDFKITCNFNFLKLNNFIDSKWYESKYNIDHYYFENIKNKKDPEYNILNVISIPNFEIKYIYDKIYNFKEIPKLIYNNNYQKIYYLKKNKYEKPISEIIITRKNINLLDDTNKFIFNIYIVLIFKIFNYYLDPLLDYNLYFNITIQKDFVVYDFYGLNYLLLDYYKNILNNINFDKIFNFHKINEYFENIKNDIILNINNIKYDSPSNNCKYFLFNKIHNSLDPEKKILLLNKLDLFSFKNNIKELLDYSEETLLLISIEEKKDILDNLENLSGKYNNNIIKNFNYNFFENLNSFYVNKQFINKDEVNNCFIKSYIIKIIDVKYDNNIVNINDLKKFIKYKIITNIIREMLNEPLFDFIRTIQKLGYIVYCNKFSDIIYNKGLFLIYYLVQSDKSINRIHDSINQFNKYIINNLINNENEYINKFETLKENKLIEYQKSFTNLEDEKDFYLDIITLNYDNFKINKMFYKICKKINFNTIKNTIIKILNNNSFDIIIQK